MHLYQIELYSGVSRKQKIKKRLPCKTDLNYSKIQKTEEKEKKMFEKKRGRRNGSRDHGRNKAGCSNLFLLTK